MLITAACARNCARRSRRLPRRSKPATSPPLKPFTRIPSAPWTASPTRKSFTRTRLLDTRAACLQQSRRWHKRQTTLIYRKQAGSDVGLFALWGCLAQYTPLRFCTRRLVRRLCLGTTYVACDEHLCTASRHFCARRRRLAVGYRRQALSGRVVRHRREHPGSCASALHRRAE